MSAHTISRRLGLERISEDQHVYEFSSGIAEYIKSERAPQFPARRGVRQASTFFGFCGRHDSELFKTLDSEEFRGSHEQILLLGYRAVARELFAKRAQAGLIPWIRTLDRGKDLSAQREQQAWLNWAETGTLAGLEDAEREKSKYDQCLLARCFDSVEFTVLRTAERPELVCCGATQPSHDLDGRQLRDMFGPTTPLPVLTFTILPVETGGVVVFAWVGSSDLCSRFVASIDDIEPAQLGGTIVEFAFNNFENVFARPSWWDRLSRRAQKFLVERMWRGNVRETPSTVIGRPDDVGRLVRWTITDRETHLGRH